MSRVRPAPSARAWLASFVAALVLGQIAHGFEPGASVDFYQFWGVGAARAESPGLATPWVAPDAYRAALERRLGGDPRAELRSVHRFRMAHFEPFGSPLLYLGFAAFPDDYLRALQLLHVLQLLAFAGAVCLLVRPGSWPAWAALALPACMAVLYRPFGDDLLTGNLNALQLGALAVGVRWIASRPAAPPPGRSAAAFCALVALALGKPNLAPAAAGLALCLGLRLGARAWVRAGALAAPGVALLLLAPCLYFDSARAWLDWTEGVFAAEPARLAEYALAAGNTSTPRLLEEALGIPVLVSGALLAVVLLASALALPRRAWRDPALASGAGVVLVLAAAPLVWFHYFVLALLPGLWLAGSARGGPLPRILAGAALLVYAGFYLPVVPRSLLPGLYALWSLTWIPLAVALWLRGRASAPGSTTLHA